MTRNQVIATLYIAVLAVFFIVIGFGILIDILGMCAYKNGVMGTCQIGQADVAALYNGSSIFGIFANTSYFFVWILLGGCTLYIRDWWTKRNA